MKYLFFLPLGIYTPCRDSRAVFIHPAVYHMLAQALVETYRGADVHLNTVSFEIRNKGFSGIH